jgi:hypothetical protein
VQLEAIEAGYLALCRKGLKGHKTSLLEAIRIMLDLGIVAEEAKRTTREDNGLSMNSAQRSGFRHATMFTTDRERTGLPGRRERY